MSHTVYRYFSATGELLYVGCTQNLVARDRAHRKTSSWFPSASRLATEGPYEESLARAIEKAAIQNEQPQHNQHYTGKPQHRRPSLRQLNGDAVKALREAQGLSLRRLAASIDRNPGFLSRLERGLLEASPATQIAIAGRLGVPIDAITHVRAAA